MNQIDTALLGLCVGALFVSFVAMLGGFMVANIIDGYYDIIHEMEDEETNGR